MSGYTPQVGDRVRLLPWSQPWITVTAVGGHKFLATDKSGIESSYYIEANWLKVPEPVVYPERWINVYRRATSVGHYERLAADSNSAGLGRIAVIHLAADGTLTLHPVERES
jgi:hypothetical protein